MELGFALLSSLDRGFAPVRTDVLPRDDHDMVTTSIRDAYRSMTTVQSVSNLTRAPPYPLHALAVSPANVVELVPHPPDVRLDVEDCTYRSVSDDRDIEVPGDAVYTCEAHWLVHPDLRIAWQVDGEPVGDQFLQRGRH